MGLGGLDTFSLAESRARARKMRQLVADGIDPIEQRASARGKAAVKPVTFRQAAERYIAANEAGWKNGGGDWRGSLEKHVFPHFGDQPVAAIDLPMVLAAIEPKWAKQPVRMGIVRGRIELVLHWAKTRALRSGENPARWKGHLETLLPDRKRVATVEHRKAMPFVEVAAFVAQLRQDTDITARVLEFLVLTALRPGAVVGARWDEVDMAARVWTIPAERMKLPREHRVPLSNAAMAVLDQMASLREGEFVFCSARRSDKAIDIGAAMKPLKKRGLDFDAAGFRSSFRDWAGERTNFAREVAEEALAHKVGDDTERAYRRGDFLAKRAALMQAWADFLEQPAAPAKGEVVAIRGGAKM
jgi:integrase